LRSQTSPFLCGELEREIFREALAVTAHLLIESSHLDLIKLGQVAVEHHPLVAHFKAALADLAQKSRV
jgi:hypothetical protein